jgi:NADH-quinone oxidoreductase subunit I
MIVGWGVLKTLLVTLGRFVMTYVEDVRRWVGRLRSKAPSPRRYGAILTRQYPEERPVLPEAYRNLPFLVIDAETSDGGPSQPRLRCTACGICAQICPVQCIWIERAADPETGRPRRYPVTYTLDVSLCMSCGLCVEFCPFDAIKMDHDYEFASYRRPGLVSAKALVKPKAYDVGLHPSAYDSSGAAAGDDASTTEPVSAPESDAEVVG